MILLLQNSECRDTILDEESCDPSSSGLGGEVTVLYAL